MLRCPRAAASMHSLIKKIITSQRNLYPKWWQIYICFSTYLAQCCKSHQNSFQPSCMNECLWPVPGAVQAGVFLALDCSQLVQLQPSLTSHAASIIGDSHPLFSWGWTFLSDNSFVMTTFKCGLWNFYIFNLKSYYWCRFWLYLHICSDKLHN